MFLSLSQFKRRVGLKCGMKRAVLELITVNTYLELNFLFFHFVFSFMSLTRFRNRNYCRVVGSRYARRGGHTQTNISFARLLFDNSAYTRQTRA